MTEMLVQFLSSQQIVLRQLGNPVGINEIEFLSETKQKPVLM